MHRPAPNAPRPPRPPFLSGRAGRLAGLALAALWLAVHLPAQNPGGRVRGRFEVPFFDEQNRRISLLTGSQATLRGAGEVFLASVHLESYDAAGRTNLHVYGTNCLFNPNRQRAGSTNALRVVSGDGRLTLDGLGFGWWQTNNTLVISNAVRTQIQRLPGATNAPLRIRSDSLQARLDTSTVTFRGSVRAEDPEFNLACDRLSVRRNPEGELDRIEALGNVTVNDLRDASRITAERATYRLNGADEQVEFAGRPRWESGPRRAEAERFLLDRRRNRVTALGGAVILLPRSTASLNALTGPGGAASGTGASAPGGTNDLVELRAGRVDLQLPATNGPVQEVRAVTNVQIRLPGEGLAARAHTAAYLPGGRFRLEGEPSWSWGRRSGAGDVIEFATNGTFRITGHARLRFPVAALRTALGDGAPTAGTAGPAALTNLLVEVRSDHVDYRDGVIEFGDEVNGRCTDGDTLLGTMRSDELQVAYRDRIESVTAAGNVLAEELPRRNAAGALVGRTLSADRLTARLGPDGRLREVEAVGKVTGVQTEQPPRASRPVVSRLNCEAAHAWLAPDTNRVDRLTATGGVQVVHGARMAWGNRVDYTAAEGRLKLTGGPLVLLPEGRVLGARELTWDPGTGRFGGRGPFRTFWRQAPFNTNALTFRPAAVTLPGAKQP